MDFYDLEHQSDQWNFYNFHACFLIPRSWKTGIASFWRVTKILTFSSMGSLARSLRLCCFDLKSASIFILFFFNDHIPFFLQQMPF